VGAVGWVVPFGLQALLMAVDEFHFHGRRGLSRWEWVGHAVDSAAFLACLALPLALKPTPGHLALFAGLALGSCALVTKDEFIHQRECSGGEHWCHAVLFLLHPVVLMATALLWLSVHEPAETLRFGTLVGLGAPSPAAAAWLLQLQGGGVAAFLVFQVAYWARR